MPSALETIGATGEENESKYRSGRGIELLTQECFPIGGEVLCVVG